MKYSRIIGIFLIACVVITFLGIVSAEEITVGGEKFNIPDGFNRNEGGCYVAKGTTTSEEVALYDIVDNAEYISILVSSSAGIEPTLPIDSKYEEKTIAGIDGKYGEDEAGVTFMYTNNENFISISLSHNCSVSFEDIIINTTSEGSSSVFDLFK